VGAVAISTPLFAGVTIFATTGAGNLLSFDSDTPGAIESNVAISGLEAGESILGIDFRPAAPGILFGLGSGSNLYTINTGTGAATKVGTGFTTPLDDASFGFDFNPVIDRVRVVGSSNQNLVANPDTGDANVAATVEVFYPAGDVNEGLDPAVFASAYTNNVAGAASTQLFGIDANRDVLATQANNTGVLGTVGSLGVDVLGVGGFDLLGDASYASLTTNGINSGLYSIDLATGQGTLIGDIGVEGLVTGLSITNAPVAIPVPAALLMAPLTGLIAAIGYRRMRKTVTA